MNRSTRPARRLSSSRLLKFSNPHCCQPIAVTSTVPMTSADGPILRALNLAVEEIEAQITWLEGQAEAIAGSDPEHRQEAEGWAAALAERLEQVGGLTLEAPHAAPSPCDLPGRRPFKLAEIPARDPRFHLCHYYWPDIVDPNFAYGEGINLQLRSGVSHLNEVWAVETGGAILHAFADDLDWEYIYDAGRWTYDESRHVLMGYERLRHGALHCTRCLWAATSTTARPGRSRSFGWVCFTTSRPRISATRSNGRKPSRNTGQDEPARHGVRLG